MSKPRRAGCATRRGAVGRPVRRPPPFVWLAATAALVLLIAAGTWQLAALGPSRSGRGLSPVAMPTGVPSGIAGGGVAYLGAASAPVTIDEYGDFQCPACREFATEVAPAILRTYVTRGQVRIVWHTMAFIGRESVWAAEAALCAGEQQAFWRYYALLYARQGPENSGAFSALRLADLAQEGGLDTGRFRGCLSQQRYLEPVQRSQRAGAARGVRVTPTFFINGRKMEGAPTIAQMTQAIDAALHSDGR